MLMLLTFVILLFICLNTRLKRKKMNFAQVQNIIWLIMCLIYLFNIFDYYPVGGVVYALGILYIASFNMFYIYRNGAVVELDGDNIIQLYEDVHNSKITKRILFYSVCVWVLSLPMLVKSVPLVKQYGILVMRYMLYSEQSYFSSIEMCAIDFIIRPMITVSIIFLVEQFITHKMDIIIIIVTIINCFLIVLLTGGRAMLMQLVFYFALATISAYGNNILKIIRKNLRYVVPAACLLIAILIVSSKRISNGNNVFEEALVYIFSGPAYLSGLFREGIVNPFISYGFATFSSIIDTISLALRVFGIELNVFELSSITSKVIMVSPTVDMNAIATTLLPFYCDFGALGVFGFGAILGYMCKKQEIKTACNFNRINVAIYLFLANGVWLSVQSFGLSGASTFIAFLLILWIMR